MGQWRPQWTPGPWHIESEDWGDGCNPTGITDEHDTGIIRSHEGFAFWHQDQPESGTAWANARLIAAAPDLYDALEHAFARMPSKDPAWQGCLNETYAALKKAGMQ